MTRRFCIGSGAACWLAIRLQVRTNAAAYASPADSAGINFLNLLLVWSALLFRNVKYIPFARECIALSPCV